MLLLRWTLLIVSLGVAFGQGGDNEIVVTTTRELEGALENVQNGQSVVIDTERLSLRRSLTVTRRNITVRGVEETTLECPEAATALFLSGRDIRLENLRFTRCQGEAAVVIEGRGQRTVHVSMERVIFDDNEATSEGSNSFSGPRSPLLVRRCQQTPCQATVSAEIAYARFLRNGGDQGGAIFCQDASLTIRNATFRRNAARRSGGAIYATGPFAAVSIDSCRFEENEVTGTGQERPVTATTTGQPLEVVTYWTFAFPSAIGGAIDSFTVASIVIRNSSFASNLAPAGGAVAIAVDEDTVLDDDKPASFVATISDCAFEQNQANYSEAVFEDQTAVASEVQMGGAVYIVSNTPDFVFAIEDSTFLSNRARFGGALHLVASAASFPQIRKSHFSQNEATESGGAILLRNTGQMEFRETNCTENFAWLGGCMMLTNNAGLQVEGPAGLPPNRQGISSYFERNSAIHGGAILCAACHDVILREPYFLNNTAMQSGGAVYVLESDHTFSIQQSTLQGNQALLGGAVSVEGAGNVQVRGNIGLMSYFRENRAVAGGAIHASANSQRENRFQVTSPVLITFQRPLFLDGGYAERISDDQVLNASSQLSSCGEGGGGALCLAMIEPPSGAVAEVIVQDTLIEGNEAIVGGGVFASVKSEANWNQAERERGRCPATRLYEPCRSFRFINVTITQNFASSGAGGIFITDPRSLSLQCRLESDDGSPLSDAMEDGTVEQEGNDICNTILRNDVHGDGFGPNGATDVYHFTISDSSRRIMNHTSGERLLPECPDCSEDRTEGIQVEIHDYFHQIIAKGIPAAEQAVRLVSNAILGERRYVAERGVVNINNTRGIGVGISRSVLAIEAVDDPSLRTKIEFSTRSCYPGEEENEISCEVCRPMEYAFSPASPGCQQCEAHAVCAGGAAMVPVDGFWHSTPFSPQFHECIVRDACSYTNREEVLSAYYANRYAMDTELHSTDQILEAGEKPSFPDYEQCAEGYTGILCGSCEPGYGHFAGGECVECPMDKTGAILISILVAVWLTFFVGANIVTTLSSTHRQIRFAVYKKQVTAMNIEMQSRNLTAPSAATISDEESREKTSDSMDDRITATIKLTEILKILVNYLQVTSVAVSINLNWIGLIEGLLSVELMLIGVTSGSHFVPLDCTFDEEEEDEREGVPNSIKVLWLRATFPLIMLAFFFFASCVYVLRKRRISSNSHKPSGISDFVTIRSYAVVVVIVVVFFSYISITSEFMRTVNCIRVDEMSTGHRYDLYAIETGDRVWAEDTSLHCFQGDHTATGVFGILGLIFFSLAVIVFILTWLPYNAARLDDPAFIAQYGFIYQGYKESWYATPWEAVIAIRKALIAAAVVFAFPLGPNLQGVCAMGVVILAIALHFIFAPFKTFKGHPNVPPYAGQVFRFLKLDAVADAWVCLNNRISLNALEAASLLMSLVVFYAGVLFNDDNTSEGGKYTMAAFTFSVNLCFILYILYRLYYGAHVSVNLYCGHLKTVAPTRSIPEGRGVISLIMRGITIYQNRDVFRGMDNSTKLEDDTRLEESI